MSGAEMATTAADEMPEHLEPASFGWTRSSYRAREAERAFSESVELPDVDSLGTYAPSVPRKVLISEVVTFDVSKLPRRKPVVPDFEPFE
jgi:hypothetical protein